MNTECVRVVEICLQGAVGSSEVIAFAETILREPYTDSLQQLCIIKAMEVRAQEKHVSISLIPFLNSRDSNDFKPLFALATPDLGLFLFRHTRTFTVGFYFSITEKEYELSNLDFVLIKGTFEANNVPIPRLLDIIETIFQNQFHTLIIAVKEEIAEQMQLVAKIEILLGGLEIEIQQVRTKNGNTEITIEIMY